MRDRIRSAGAVLASGDDSGTGHLRDVRTGACVGGPLHAGSIVLSLAFSPDGAREAVRLILDGGFPADPFAP